MRLQKLGGFASIGIGCILVIGTVLHLRIWPPNGGEDPAKYLEAIDASPIEAFIYNLLSVLGSIAIVLVVLAVRDRMEKMAPNLMRIVVICGSIGGALWLTASFTGIAGVPEILNAKDLSASMVVVAFTEGLLGASEHAMGWALLLICWAALRNKDLPKSLSLVLGIKGILMIVTFGMFPLQLAGALLGVFAYPWLGIALLRSKSRVYEQPK